MSQEDSWGRWGQGAQGEGVMRLGRSLGQRESKGSLGGEGVNELIRVRGEGVRELTVGEGTEGAHR